MTNKLMKEDLNRKVNSLLGERSYIRRQCPHCKSNIQITADVCNECTRDAPCIIDIPNDLSFNELPDTEKESITKASDIDNFNLAIELIKNNKIRNGIAILQYITDYCSKDNYVYERALFLLYNIIKISDEGGYPPEEYMNHLKKRSSGDLADDIMDIVKLVGGIIITLLFLIAILSDAA